MIENLNTILIFKIYIINYWKKLKKKYEKILKFLVQPHHHFLILSVVSNQKLIEKKEEKHKINWFLLKLISFNSTTIINLFGKAKTYSRNIIEMLCNIKWMMIIEIHGNVRGGGFGFVSVGGDFMSKKSAVSCQEGEKEKKWKKGKFMIFPRSDWREPSKKWKWKIY